MSDKRTLLRVRDLRTWFDTEDGVVKAVDGVSFAVRRKETFALVGESGCGKSVTALAIMRLIPAPPGRIVSGKVELEGQDLLQLGERQMRRVRGAQISMIFQEPMSSLNPVYTCGNQIVEAITLHRNLPGAEAKNLAIELLRRVGIPEPEHRFGEYPHQLSGGMRQRVMIAMALSCNPRLLIADEPTTALDVTTQAQILDLMRQIQERHDLSILLITHDLAVVAQTAHRVGVMYASRIVEMTDVGSLFASPLHPYTHGLLGSIPRLGQKKHRLTPIPGSVPNPLFMPSGCEFHTRCPLTRRCAAGMVGDGVVTISTEEGAQRVLRRCAAERPTLREISCGHWCACWEVAQYERSPQTDPGDQEHANE